MRSATVLALKGYFTDANSILRSVFELNKAINAIQNEIIEVGEYFSAKRNDSFKDLPDKEKYKLINDHIHNIDNKINNFDYKDIPGKLKNSLRIFK